MGRGKSRRSLALIEASADLAGHFDASLGMRAGVTLTALLDRLDGVRREGDQYIARCPAHDGDSRAEGCAT